MANDVINPEHYKQNPSGLECIEVVSKMNFTLGNACKYLWRYKDKNGLEDLKKALWYLDYTIQHELTIANHGSPIGVDIALKICQNYPFEIQFVLFTLLTMNYKRQLYSYHKETLIICKQTLARYIQDEEVANVSL